jgi:hypothetical protein
MHAFCSANTEKPTMFSFAGRGASWQAFPRSAWERETYYVLVPTRSVGMPAWTLRVLPKKRKTISDLVKQRSKSRVRPTHRL